MLLLFPSLFLLSPQANTYPELKVQIGTVLDAHRSYVDCELQQRACEYYVLNNPSHAKLMESVLDVMPNYSERESLLLKRISKAANKSHTDRDVWGDKDPVKMKEREEEERKRKEKASKEDADDDESDSSSSSSSSDSDSSDSSSDDSSSDEEGAEGTAKKSKPSKPAGASVDLLGLGGSSTSAAAAPSSSSSSSASTTASNATAVGTFPPQGSIHSLLGKESGVLYETRDLQIGLKLSVENNNSAKLVFYYGNRCPNTIKDVSATLPSSDAFKMQCRPTEAFDVPPKKQVMHFFLVHCFKPFHGPIQVQIQFTYLDKSDIHLHIHTPHISDTFNGHSHCNYV